MEAYLDWQSKSGGIKLNDVIEEYRYVANGQTVKKGDFLTYVGEDVAPAIEPPFNAIALSNAVNGEVKIVRVYREISGTGNLFAKTWTKVEGTEDKLNPLPYVAEDGSVLSTLSLNTTDHKLSRVCDGDESSFCGSSGSTDVGGNHWIKIQLSRWAKVLSQA